LPPCARIRSNLIGRGGMYAALLAATFYPVWHWYVLRYSDRSDEPLGILALLTALVIALAYGGQAKWRSPRRANHSLAAGIFCTLLYAGTFCFSPQAVHGLLAKNRK